MKKKKILISLLFFLVLLKILPASYRNYQAKKLKLEEDSISISNYNLLKYTRLGELEDLERQLRLRLDSSDYQTFIENIYRLENGHIKVLDLKQLSSLKKEELNLEIIERRLDLGLEVENSQALDQLKNLLARSNNIKLLGLDYRREEARTSLYLSILMEELMLGNENE